MAALKSLPPYTSSSASGRTTPQLISRPDTPQLFSQKRKSQSDHPYRPHSAAFSELEEEDHGFEERAGHQAVDGLEDDRDVDELEEDRGEEDADDERADRRLRREDEAHMPHELRARRFRRKYLNVRRTSTMMVIVDTSGVHEIEVRFCKCMDCPPADQQLMKHSLYPATHRNPRTAFTFRLLDDVLLTNKECKTSIMNLFQKLRRVTNDTFPHDVPVSWHDGNAISWLT